MMAFIFAGLVLAGLAVTGAYTAKVALPQIREAKANPRGKHDEETMVWTIHAFVLLLLFIVELLLALQLIHAV